MNDNIITDMMVMKMIKKPFSANQNKQIFDNFLAAELKNFCIYLAM